MSGIDPGQKNLLFQSLELAEDVYARIQALPPGTPAAVGRRMMEESGVQIGGRFYRTLSGSHRGENKEANHLDQLDPFADPNHVGLGPPPPITYQEVLELLSGLRLCLAGTLADLRAYDRVHSRYRPILLELFEDLFYRREAMNRVKYQQKALRLTGSLLAGRIDVSLSLLLTHLSTNTSFMPSSAIESMDRSA